MWSDKSKSDVLQGVAHLQILASAIEAQLRFGEVSPDAVLSLVEDMRRDIDLVASAASWDRAVVDEDD